MNKFCLYCGKDISDIPRKEKFCSDGCQGHHYYRRPEIREKYRLRAIEYRKKHPEWKEKHRIQQAKRKEKRAIYGKKYFSRPEIKAKMNEYAKWKRKNNYNYAIASRLRKSVRHALIKYSREGKIMSTKKYGIDLKMIIEHLKPFPLRIEDYDIDHIIPLRIFNLSDLEQVKLAFSPKNLQWLTKTENRSKGGRIKNFQNNSSITS